MLSEMGFPPNVIQSALQRTNYDVSAALEILMRSGNEILEDGGGDTVLQLDISQVMILFCNNFFCYVKK